MPFVAKATGVPIAKIAARVMAGERLASFHLEERPLNARGGEGGGVPVHPVPQRRYHAGAGDEIDRRGDGHRQRFPRAFAKSQLGSGTRLPVEGTVFLSVRDADKRGLTDVARRLTELGFKVIATSGTAAYLRRQGVNVGIINKVLEGRPHCVDAMLSGQVQLVVNTTEGAQAVSDSFSIRRTRSNPQHSALHDDGRRVALPSKRSRRCTAALLMSPRFSRILVVRSDHTRRLGWLGRRVFLCAFRKFGCKKSR